MKQIGTNDIADGAVTTSKIADGSVTSSKLAFDVDPPRTATLIVKKIIVNNVGAPFPTASDFLIDVNGDNPLPSRFPGSASGVTVFLAPGPYAVTEDRIPQMALDHISRLIHKIASVPQVMERAKNV